MCDKQQIILRTLDPYAFPIPPSIRSLIILSVVVTSESLRYTQNVTF